MWLLRNGVYILYICRIWEDPWDSLHSSCRSSKPFSQTSYLIIMFPTGLGWRIKKFQAEISQSLSQSLSLSQFIVSFIIKCKRLISEHKVSTSTGKGEGKKGVKKGADGIAVARPGIEVRSRRNSRVRPVADYIMYFIISGYKIQERDSLMN